jgi:hypothetical protein
VQWTPIANNTTTSEALSLKVGFRKHVSTAALLLVATGSLQSQADNTQYRWENSEGGVVFSDRPPADGAEYKQLDTQPSSNRDPLQGQDNTEGTDTANAAAESADTKNDALCENARLKLVALEGSNKVSVRDAQGEVRDVTPEERAIAQQTAKARVEVYCD